MAERKAPVWWGIPKRFSERARERKISWLELFYDLVYAAAISQLTEHLAQHPNMHGLLHMLFLFAFLFWSWLNGSLYHDLHGNSGVRTRLATLWQMMSIAAVAITIPDVFRGHHQGFAVSFSGVQLVITYLWWSTGYYEPAHKVLNKYYVRMSAISLVIIIISAFVPYHIALGLWVLVLLSNFSSGLLSRKTVERETLKRGETFSASDSIIERFGLFTIIVLGEAILGIIHGVSGSDDTPLALWVCFILSILIAFLLWWIYFDMLGQSSAKPGYMNLLYLSTGYLPLLVSFAITGAMLRVMLSDVNAAPHNMARTMFGAAVAVILISTAVLLHIMQQDEAEERAMNKLSWLIFFTSIAVALITVAGNYCSLLLYLVLMVATLVTCVIFGFRVWLGYGLFTED